MDEVDGWGLKLARYQQNAQPESKQYRCKAKDGFTCFHKGSNGRCLSPDGVHSEGQSHGFNDKQKCKFRSAIREPKSREPIPLAKPPKKAVVSSENRAPGGNNERQHRVIKELDRRIRILKQIKAPVTSHNIAKLGRLQEEYVKDRQSNRGSGEDEGRVQGDGGPP